MELKLRKSEIRARQKKIRLAMDSNKSEELSRRIMQRLLTELDWEAVHNVHIYQSIITHREVRTDELFRVLWQNFPNLRTASWQKDGNNFRARWYRDGNWGETVEPKHQYQVIIVPMLAFDKRGHRIGFGGGFYDRFLSNQSQAKIIGLSYESGLVNDWPEETHDIPMHAVVTERAFRAF